MMKVETRPTTAAAPLAELPSRAGGSNATVSLVNPPPVATSGRDAPPPQPGRPPRFQGWGRPGSLSSREPESTGNKTLRKEI